MGPIFLSLGTTDRHDVPVGDCCLEPLSASRALIPPPSIVVLVTPHRGAPHRLLRTHTTRREMIQDTMAGPGAAPGGNPARPRMQLPEAQRPPQQGQQELR
jgi:hypothetical protein